MAALKIEQNIGYNFRQKGLLEEALTHPSCAKAYSNQRLEFLGDTVLGLLVAKIIFRLFPNEKEGDLARRHAALVCGESLVHYAREIGLGEALILAEGEASSGGRENPTNLEDAVEALMGAVFMDGGMEAVDECFESYFEVRAGSVKTPPKDPKTALQEWAQALGKPLPEYQLAATDGPSHAPVFTIEVKVGDTVISATANTKRAAEREAARLMLEQVGDKND